MKGAGAWLSGKHLPFSNETTEEVHVLFPEGLYVPVFKTSECTSTVSMLEVIGSVNDFLKLPKTRYCLID